MNVPRLLIGLLLIVLSALVLLSLVTYDSDDLSTVRAEGLLTPRVHNAGGTMGVYISHYLRAWAGSISQYALPLLLLLWGINRLIGRGAPHMLAWSSYLVAVAVGIALLRSLPYCPLRAGVVGSAVARGGLLGTFLADRLVRIVGRAGAYLITGAVLVGGLPWVAGLDWLRRLGRDWEAYAVRRKRKRIPSKRPRRGGKRRPASPPPVPPILAETSPARTRDQSDASAAGPGDYRLPELNLLDDPPPEAAGPSDKELRLSSQVLEEKLHEYGVEGRVVAAHPGPVITRYEVAPAPGVKVSRFLSLCDDLALAMRARSIRVVAPIPGKGAVGIEVPNPAPQTVVLKEIASSDVFRTGRSPLLAALGKDISGDPVVLDLAKAPHLLVAGSTGSGKSVCLNAITTGLLFRCAPTQVRFVMIDPKMLELTHYRGIPHLMGNVITSPRGAVRALGWAVGEMERRYKLLASATSRDIGSYNRKVTSGPLMGEGAEALAYIVIIIDELADLMMTLPGEMEEAIGRLAQMARAVGIHLVVATQRPSVDVITGVIKANFPCRVSFQVASKTDSRTILDANGAERLLGKGDMLYSPAGSSELVRVHGCYVSTREVGRVVRFWRDQGGDHEDLAVPEVQAEEDTSGERIEDELYPEAVRLVIRHDQGSASLLQRRLKIGYACAGRLIDIMERNGVVGPSEGSKPRDVLVDQSYLDTLEAGRG